MENCSESGILFKGSKQTCRVHIGDTQINNCHNGITCEMGKIVVSIVSTTITDMICCGVLICPSVIGRVEINNCSITNCRKAHVANATEVGEVLVDGIMLSGDRHFQTSMRVAATSKLDNSRLHVLNVAKKKSQARSSRSAASAKMCATAAESARRPTGKNTRKSASPH